MNQAMKFSKPLVIVLTLVLFCLPNNTNAQYQQNPVLGSNTGMWLAAGMDAFRAMTLSEKQILMVASQYAAQSDAQNRIAPSESQYAQRLAKLTGRHVLEDGMRLSYRVYLSPQVNAFALADGTVRVYSGLMDIMTDEEILGVIGHEVGHVKNGDHKDKLRTALLTSAARKAAATSNGMVGQLALTGMGAIAENLINAKFSRTQEIDADDYGLKFLQRNGYNTRAMATALAKLAKLGGQRSNFVQNMFSTHPDPAKRATRMAKMVGILK
jgi:metalloprotease